MYIVSPLSQCVSVDKSNRFLDYIKKIAPVTLSTEPNCIGYAWFRSANDNDVVPTQWVRGFEVYSSAAASRVDHRASDEYKAFRSAVGEEGLLARPSDLRFWHPSGIGFFTKEGQAMFASQDNGSKPQYIVTDELKVAPGTKDTVLSQLGRIATIAANTEDVLTFWVLGRTRPDGLQSVDVEDDAFFVLIRARDRIASEKFHEVTTESEWDAIANSCVDRRRTTWVESGIGFLGRSTSSG
ncbi:hypothetical protein HJFPF1_10485 [Paramyrothecium foliicola]|nr:hypothetical protein HJFPF1_10485 [Paramyrothecium foliicola]